MRTITPLIKPAMISMNDFILNNYNSKDKKILWLFVRLTKSDLKKRKKFNSTAVKTNAQDS